MNYMKHIEILRESKSKNFCRALLDAAVSEWLRSLIRNQMGYARVGSNPARCADNDFNRVEI